MHLLRLWKPLTAHSGLNPSSHGKEGWMKTYPLVKGRIHSISQKIIRLPPNPKHIHLIRKIISDVVHGLDVDSRWTCRWTSIMYFPDDKLYPQIQNSQATYAQWNYIWKMAGKMISSKLISARMNRKKRTWPDFSWKPNMRDKNRCNYSNRGDIQGILLSLQLGKRNEIYKLKVGMMK